MRQHRSFDHLFVNEIGRRVTDRVVNDVGSRDVWPAFAKSATTGYGDTGTYGFRHPKVRDRWFKGFRHSDFLTPDFCRDYWVPFFTNGKKGLDKIDEKGIVPTPPERKKKKLLLWLSGLAVFEKEKKDFDRRR